MIKYYKIFRDETIYYCISLDTPIVLLDFTRFGQFVEEITKEQFERYNQMYFCYSYNKGVNTILPPKPPLYDENGILNIFNDKAISLAERGNSKLDLINKDYYFKGIDPIIE